MKLLFYFFIFNIFFFKVPAQVYQIPKEYRYFNKTVLSYPDNFIKNYTDLFIENFGAKGDGITDDTEAFQIALSNAENKKLILQNNKRYRIYNTLSLKKGCIIEGNNSIMLNYNSHVLHENDNRQLFMITESDCSIRNLNIQNTKYNGSVSRNITSNRASDISVGTDYNNSPIKNISLSNITIKGGIKNTSAIIFFGNCKNSLIENCDIEGEFLAGYHCEWNMPLSGIMNPRSIIIKNCRIINNLHEGSSYGFYISGSINVSLYNCFAQNCINSFGLYTGDKGIKPPDESSIKVFNCSSLDHRNCGFEVRGGYDKKIDYYRINVLIDSCYIKGYSNQIATGILIAEKAQNVLIRNSKILNNLFGIYCSISKNINIVNNKFEDIYLNSIFSYRLIESKITENNYFGEGSQRMKFIESRNNLIQ